MLTTRNIAEILQTTPLKQHSAIILHWKLVERVDVYAEGTPVKLRIEVTYGDGKVRVLPPKFDDRDHMNRYLNRFLPHLAGKEIV